MKGLEILDKALIMMLVRYLSETSFFIDDDGTEHVIFTKKRVAVIPPNVNVYVNSNDHNPPHFHVRTNNGINAKFSIKDGSYMKGKINNADKKRVKAYYDLHRDELVETWNEFAKDKNGLEIL